MVPLEITLPICVIYVNCVW